MKKWNLRKVGSFCPDHKVCALPVLWEHGPWTDFCWFYSQYFEECLQQGMGILRKCVKWMNFWKIKKDCISTKPPVSNISSFALYWKDFFDKKKRERERKFESLILRRIFSLFQIKISLMTKNLTLILGMDIRISRSIGCPGLQVAGSHSSSCQQQWNSLLSLESCCPQPDRKLKKKKKRKTK